jgi:hypothetical protein
VIRPTIGELLSGVATGLRERVLPEIPAGTTRRQIQAWLRRPERDVPLSEIPAGTTRRQIQAAIGIIARVALVWDKTAPYLYADNEDIAETLARMLPILKRVASEEGNAQVRAVLTKLDHTLKHTSEPLGPCPSAEVLGARNLEFQEVLAELQETLHEATAVHSAARSEVNAEVYALFRRMLTRELEITQPPRRR